MNIEGELSIQIQLGNSHLCNVKMRSSRPLQTSSLLEGQKVSRALSLLPTIFNICGMAQATAGIRACESAQGKQVSGKTEQNRNRLVAMETMREHLWRVFLDWPEFTGTSANKAAALAEIMEIQRTYEQAMFVGGKRVPLRGAHFKPNWEKLGLLQQRINQLLEARIYGMPPARWLDMESPAQLDVWMDRQQTVAAHYLSKIRTLGWEAVGCNDIGVLPALDEVRLYERMNENGFISAPSWGGQCRETSPFTRTRSALLQALRIQYGNGLMPRLVARLTEVAQLAQWRPPAEASPEESAREEGIGVGQVQAARGLLTHGVMLDDEGRIERYRILAPTEWNFHPQGVVANSLAVLDGDKETVEMQARQLIHAIDPCVGYALHIVSCDSGVEE